MNRNERLDDPVIGFLAAIQGTLSGLWTALPAKVVGTILSKQTVVVQPQIQAKMKTPNGEQVWVDMPLLLDVPIVFPSGGGFTLTFPIEIGDECLVVFSSRNIDTWWDQGSKGPVNDLRMHDLSDGFAIFGPRSRPNAVSNISFDAVELRNDAHTAKISIGSTGIITIDTTANVVVNTQAAANITATSAISLTAPVVNVNGNLVATGTITAPTVIGTTNVTFGGKSGLTHTHSGVSGGSGTSGPPT